MQPGWAMNLHSSSAVLLNVNHPECPAAWVWLAQLLTNEPVVGSPFHPLGNTAKKKASAGTAVSLAGLGLVVVQLPPDRVSRSIPTPFSVTVKSPSSHVPARGCRGVGGGGV